MLHVAFSSWYDDRQIGNSRAFVVRSASPATLAATPGFRRAIAVVKNGPFRFGVGQRSAVKSATLRSRGPAVFSSTPTTTWSTPSMDIGRPSTPGSAANRRVQ